MAIAHRTNISFGLVYIPVNLFTAVEPSEISFNQLHKKCKQRIKYQKVCPHCNEEVNQSDIVKGYQYQKDQYLIFEDGELEKLKSNKDQTIEIINFIDIDELNPIFYDKSYFVVPNKSNKAYNLLLESLKEVNKLAIAKTVLGTKMRLVALIPTKEILMLETLFYYDEIKEIPKALENVEIKKSELKMARTLINQLTTKFNIQDYQDEYKAKVFGAIDKKLKGKDIVKKKEVDVTIIDLMTALEKSIKKGNARK